MAWIELHQTLREHKKMFACADCLNISRVQMIGTLVSLWLWALDNAQDGSLAGVSEKTIARVCDFPEKKAGKLVAALAEHGFLDYDGEHYFIHDWFDYAGKLMERREKDRNRKRKAVKEFHGNSAVIPQEQSENSHATVPNLTVPNLTVPNHTTEGEEKKVSNGGDKTSAPMDGRCFTEFWKAYPAGKGGSREEAWNAWKELNPSTATAWRILDSLKDWIASEQWAEDGGRFIPNAAKFLREQRWMAPPDRMACGDNEDTGPYAGALAYANQLIAAKKGGEGGHGK